MFMCLVCLPVLCLPFFQQDFALIILIHHCTVNMIALCLKKVVFHKICGLVSYTSTTSSSVELMVFNLCFQVILSIVPFSMITQCQNDSYNLGGLQMKHQPNIAPGTSCLHPKSENGKLSQKDTSKLDVASKNCPCLGLN